MTMLPGVVDEVRAGFGWSINHVSWDGTAGYMTFGVLSLPAGWRADRYDRLSLIRTTAGGTEAAVFPIVLVPNPWVFETGWMTLGVLTFLPRSLNRPFHGALDFSSVGGLTTVVLLTGGLVQFLGESAGKNRWAFLI